MSKNEKHKAESTNKVIKIGNHTEAIIQASMDGFCITDVTGKIRDVNPAYCEIIGYSREELIGKHIQQIEAVETPEQISEHTREAMEKGYRRFETKHRRKDGKIIDVEVSSQFYDLEQGKFFFSFFRDITEYKKGEKALRESEKRYKTLFEGTADGILVADIGTKQLMYANPAICRMLGYSAKEIGKMRVYDIHPKENLDYVLSEFEAQARREKTLSPGIPCLRKDGVVIYADINTAKVMINGKECNVGFFTDVTEYKRITAELESYRAKVLRAQKHAYTASMGTIVAHQINQPLTAINIHLGRAIEQIEKEAGCRRALKSVREALAEVEKAASILRKLRQYSRDPKLEATGKVRVGDTVNRIVSMVSEAAKQAQMDISQRNLEMLPEAGINETALEQILLNIIQNAIEAADGKRPHKLEIAGKFAEGNIEIGFSDDCCGIADENLEKIFEPFFSMKLDGRGMGLGLDIVQQILIGCGGQIRVESQVGKGSTFFVTLPVSNNPTPGETQ